MFLLVDDDGSDHIEEKTKDLLYAIRHARNPSGICELCLADNSSIRLEPTKPYKVLGHTYHICCYCFSTANRFVANIYGDNFSRYHVNNEMCEEFFDGKEGHEEVALWLIHRMNRRVENERKSL